jgi:hypothetical protein
MAEQVSSLDSAFNLKALVKNAWAFDDNNIEDV